MPVTRPPTPRRLMKSPSFIRRVLTVALFGAAGILSTGFAVAEHREPSELKTFRFEFDNDTFLGSDDAFTAGWSFQFHSRMMDRWTPAFAGWIGKFPGLGDDGEGGRITRWGGALSQLIITPTDITIEEPQPKDAPWAGMLGVTSTWSSYSNERLGAIQVYLGCLGPCSRAQEVQQAVHEGLGWGDPPRGWDNQLSNRALANLNYEYRHKLHTDEANAYVPGRFGNDLAVGGQAAIGNVATFLQVEIEFRFGWGMPMGFSKIPDPAGIGMVLDPVYLDPEKPPLNVEGWRLYFTVVARHAWLRYLAAAEGGPTENGNDQPPLDSYPGRRQALLGMHLGCVPFSVHLTYYRYLEPLPRNIVGSSDWVNLSFEFRF